jgi:uncharacterized beta-barrel protein YwiB (DUF1934 family)
MTIFKMKPGAAMTEPTASTGPSEPTASIAPPAPPTRVVIRIESRSGEQRIVQEAEGDLYERNGRVYIRYREEAPEYGRTMTTIKLEPSVVAIVRQGDVRSDQTFVPGQRRIGYYETAQGRLELAVRTRRAETAMNGPTGTVLLQYDLEVAGEPAGTYSVKLTIRKEAQP